MDYYADVEVFKGSKDFQGFFRKLTTNPDNAQWTWILGKSMGKLFQLFFRLRFISFVSTNRNKICYKSESFSLGNKPSLKRLKYRETKAENFGN